LCKKRAKKLFKGKRKFNETNQNKKQKIEEPKGKEKSQIERRISSARRDFVTV